MNSKLTFAAARLTRRFTPVWANPWLLLCAFLVTAFGPRIAAAPVSIWPSNPTPAATSVTNDTAEVELGLKFRSSTSGYITGVRFYKGTNNLGTHVGNLWTTNGLLLGSVVFANESASGWQQQSFSSAIGISSNTTYIISYRAPNGGYAVNGAYFATSGVTNAPLRALSDAEAGGNGVYRYGEGAFPSLSYNAANYWVDVIFDTVVPPDTNAPVVTTVSPMSGQTNVAISATISITFSEPMLASSITTNNIFLKDTTNGIVPASVALTSNPLVATLTPTGLLPSNTNFTVTIKGGVGGVADVVTNRMATDYSWSFTTAPGDVAPPTVSAFSPGSGITKVSIATAVTVAFSEPMLASSITNTTIVLRDGTGSLIPASLVFDAANRRATLTPSNYLASASNYTAFVYGGVNGVKDLSGNPLTGTNSWTFTTVPAHPYGQGPGGSILLLTQATNRMTYFLAEILLTEGLNQFALRDITNLNDTMITNFSVVVVGNLPLTAAQANTLSNWAVNGGTLIAMRPDTKLASILGLTSLGSTMAEGYIGVNTSVPPGEGIVGTTMQFHGTADRYALNGATSVATLYANATTATTNPAVTWRNVGSNGGQAACFTYDLARSVSLTRQGNPAWVGQERDGYAPLRSDDLFYGPSSSDPQPNWVDLTRVAIPQADEQQRLFVNLINHLATPKKPLPRFWYFPDGHKAVLVMTGDDHANAATSGRFDQYIAYSPTNAIVTNWQAVRSSSYIYPYTPISSNAAFGYYTNGFDIGVHISSFCDNYTREQMESNLSAQLAQFAANFPGIPSPTTYRTHCIAWSGYTLMPEIASHFGMRLDVNYYYWPPGWVQNTPGVFTGSAMPMRFAALDGTVLDVFQGATQMTDESNQTYPFTSATLLDRALDTNGFYGAYVANMHTDFNPLPDSDNIVASCQARGVPIVSAKQMLTWLDARNASYFTNVVWTNKTLSFMVSAPGAARGLKSLVPVPEAHNLVNVRSNGVVIAAAVEVIKGVDYVTFPAASASYSVTFATDTTPPVVSSLTPTNGATSVSVNTAVTVTFNESMLASSINTNTIRLLDAASNSVPAQISYNPSTFTATLLPSAPLAVSQIYTSRVVSGASGVKDAATNALSADYLSPFTTTSVQTYSVWSNSTVPANITSSETNANELGLKFRALTNGYITGIRFYKGPANTGTHVGNLWTSGGALLASNVFVNETASGWQQQDFAAPVAILANTTYVISYFCPVGGYSYNTGYFTSGSVTNSPLVALGTGVDGPNAVYKPTTSSAFPSDSAAGNNYWVDPVFTITLGPDTNAPVVQVVSPLNNATNVSINAAVSVTFNEAMDPATINTNTFMLSSGSPAAITPGAANTTFDTDGILLPMANLTVAHTNTSATNRLMLVGVAYEDDNAANFSVSSVNWVVGSTTQALTQVIQRASPFEAGGEIWSLTAPTNGAGEVRIVVDSGSTDGDAIHVGVVTLSGVNQTAPLGIAVSTNGTSSSAGILVQSSTNELVFALFAADDARSSTSGANQTELWTGIAGTANSDGIRGAAATRVGDSTTSLSWTIGSDDWAICAVPVKPAISGSVVLASASYNAGTFTATLQPATPLILNQTYTATVKGGSFGVKDLSTNALATDYLWSFITTPEQTYNLWGATTPAVTSFNDPNPYELGMKFRSLTAGFVKGVRFYKGGANTGTHQGNLWALGNTNALATVLFTNETATGWQEQNFTTPVAINSNTTYIISYHTPTGGYAVNAGGFNSGSITNPPLVALGNGVDGSNGVFNAGATSTYPGSGTAGNNYWVDAIFTQTLAADTNPPVVQNVLPSSGATNVSPATAVSVTFNEAMLAASITTNTFRLVDAASNLVTAALSYDAPTRTATLQPSNTLVLGQVYTATVKGGTNGAKDAATNALAADFVWSFTTQPPDSTPPTVASVSPTNGATGVVLNPTISVTFSEAMNVSTLTTNTVRLLDQSSNAVPVSLAYNSTNFTVTLQPTNGLQLGQLYTIRVTSGGSGVKDVAGNPLAADFTAQFTTTSEVVYSIWPSSTTPFRVTFDSGDTNTGYTFGVKFQSQVAGYIKGIRFYKGPLNNGTHFATLWSTNGTNLASAPFTNETASGWQEIRFASSYLIASNTTFIASYSTPAGGYSADLVSDPSGGLSVGVTNPPLIALANSVTPNGVFAVGTNVFPAGSGNGVNYWIDVVFQSATNLAPIVVNPIPNQTGGYGTNFAYTFPTNTFSDPEGSNLTYSATGMPAGVSFTGGTRTFSGAPTQSGSYPISVVATDSGTPNLSATNVFTLTVAKRALSITAVNTNKIYGATLQPVLYTVAGLTNADAVTNVTLTSAGSPTNAATGNYSIVVTNALGSGLTNYNISYFNGSLTVAPRSLTVSAVNTNKIYGVALQPGLYTYSGLTNADTVTNVTLASTGSPTNATVGNYSIAATNALGSGLTNYNISYVNGTLTVGLRPLLVTAANTNKVYGAALQPTLYSVAGLTNNDSVTNLTLTSSGSATNAAVGTYSIVPSTALGAGLTNYSVVYSNGTFAVNPAGLLIVAGNTNKVYGATLQPTLYSVVGLTNSDSLTNLTLTSSGTSTNATVGAYAIVPSNPMGAGLTNYSITLSNGTLTVDAGALLIVAGNTNKVYGTALQPAFYSLVGLTNNDSVTNLVLTSAGSPTNAATGAYAIVPSSPTGTGLTNYSITLSNGTLTVGTASLFITAADTNKVYGTQLLPSLYTVSGLLNSDTVTNLTLASSGSPTNAMVGNYPITPSLALGTGLTNYTIGYSNGTLMVGPANLLITAAPTNKAYGTTLQPTFYTVSGLASGDSVTNLTLTTCGSSTNAAVGTYAIVPTSPLGVGLTNYSILLSNGTLTVNAANLLISALSTNKVYGTEVSPTLFTVAGLTNNDSVTNLTLTSSGSQTNAGVGTYPIVASSALGAGLTNYSVAYSNGTLTVNAANLLITALSTNKEVGQTIVFGGTEFLTSGLVAGDSVTSATLSSAGADAAALAGAYPITVTNALGAGLTNYSIAYANGTLTVTNPAFQFIITSVVMTNGVATVTWNSISNQAYRLLYKDDLLHTNWSVVPNDVTATSASTSQTNIIGSTPMRYYRVQHVSNSVPVLPAVTNQTVPEFSTLTITNTASDAELPAELLAYTLISAPTNAAISSTGVITWTPTEQQGPSTNQFVVRVADNGGLAATNSFVVIVTEVNNAPVVQNSIPGQSGEYASSFNYQFPADTFGDVDSAVLTYSALGLPSGVSFTPATRTFSGAPAQSGVFPISVVAADDGVPSLAATNVFIFTVAQRALLITAVNTNKIYGTILQPVLYNAVGLTNGDTVTNLTLASGGTPAGAPIGAYAINATNALGIGLANYSINYTNGTLTVNAASLLIAAGNTNKVYGTPLVPSVYSVSGLLNADTVTNVTLASGGSPTNATVGAYAIVPSSPLGAGLTNYSITLSNGTLTVGAANLLITAADTNKVYGTQLVPSVYSVSGLLNADTVTNVTLASSGSPTNATVGNYPVTPSLALGTGLTNYSVVYSNGTLTVNAAGLLIVAGNTNKVYGTTLQPTLYSVAGLTNSDSVTGLTLTSGGTPTNATLGNYAIVPSSPLGAGLTNYSITLSNGTLTVGAAALLIAATDTNKVYGTQVQPSLYTVSGLLNADTVTNVTLTSSGSPTNATVGNYTITASLAQGSGLTNYSISYTNGTLSVNAASLLIVAGNTNKVYGTTLQPTLYSVTGLTNSDSVTNITLTSAGAANSAGVGSYPIVASLAQGSGLTNYAITYTNGTLSVNAANLLITALSTNKQAGQTLVFNGTEFTTSGLVAGDSVDSANLSSAGAGAAAVAGSYPITVTNALGIGLANYSITYANGSLTVTVPPQDFSITSIVASNGIATITWGAVSNITYELQYKTNLLQTNWIAVLPPVVAAGSTASMTNAMGSDEQHYYRVKAAW